MSAETGGRRSRVYLDTSVLSAYHDERTPERQQATRSFWVVLEDHEACVSDLVLEELRDTPDEERRKALQELAAGMTVPGESAEARALAEGYVEEGIFPETAEDDARHLAIATLAGADYLVSWNFRHIVKVQTRRAVNLVNALRGYAPLEIISPPEL